MNNIIKVQIDSKKYTNKPEGIEVGSIKLRTQDNNSIIQIDLNELINKISLGYTISPGILTNGRSASNWSEQTLFMVDIDNNDKNLPILTLNNALKICEDNNIIPVFYYYTFSHTKSIPKYRLAFIMNNTITNDKTRQLVINTLISLFPQSDKSCKNADRLFLGTNKQVVKYNLNSRVSLDTILAKSHYSTSKFTNTKDIELQKLIFEYDLLNYMCNDNEILRSSNDIVYFKDCSICGHSNCLRYYYNTNTFYCFGANGELGGTIIDYIMHTKNLNVKDAIKYFKYNLCNLKDSYEEQPTYISAHQLLTMKLDDIIFYVSGLIPQGITLICSVPKMGKSWLALQLCLSITNGKNFLGFQTKRSSCLYLALEDSNNRLKARTSKLLSGAPAPSNLYFNTYNKNINDGLIDELNRVIELHPDIKVIVIDTLQKIRGASKSTNVYANDYKDLGYLKSFADKNNISIILIHHLKKGIETNDIFERVSGTNGITGTADTTLILSKDKRNDKETLLSVVGRDVELNEYIIKFNKDTCTWEMISNLEEYNDIVRKTNYNKNTLIITIKKLLEEEKEWHGTLKELNHMHYNIFNKFYNDSEIKLRKDLNNFTNDLMKYDNILYIPSNKYPSNKGRIQTFKKLK